LRDKHRESLLQEYCMMNIFAIVAVCAVFGCCQSKTIDHYENDIFRNPTDENDDFYQDLQDVEDSILNELDLDSQGVGHLIYNGDESVLSTKRISTSTTLTKTTPTDNFSTTTTENIPKTTDSVPTTSTDINMIVSTTEPKTSTENIPQTTREPDQTSEIIQASSTEEIPATTSENTQMTDNVETTEGIVTMATDIFTKEPRTTKETFTTKPTRETTTKGKIRKSKILTIIRKLIVKVKTMEEKQRTLGRIVMQLNTKLVRLVLKKKMKKISI